VAAYLEPGVRGSVGVVEELDGRGQAHQL
jgi:hypothetical protein